MQQMIKPLVQDAHTNKEYDFNNYIEACRWIVKEHQCLKIDGTLIDVQTANAVITVYDALNEANKERALFMPIVRFAKLAWRQVE